MRLHPLEVETQVFPRRDWRPLAASPDSEVRLELAHYLGRCTPDREAFGMLMSLLGDVDEEVRCAAVEALSEYVGVRARQSLRRRARVELAS